MRQNTRQLLFTVEVHHLLDHIHLIYNKHWPHIGKIVLVTGSNGETSYLDVSWNRSSDMYAVILGRLYPFDAGIFMVLAYNHNGS